MVAGAPAHSFPFLDIAMHQDFPPHELERERPLNLRLMTRAGRRFLPVEQSRWGELILPATDERAPSDEGMRVVMFASFEYGFLALEAVKAYAARFPGRIMLAGLATDDPVDRTALIGLKKRIWKYLDSDAQVEMETAIAESALGAGAPVFTGEIKTDGFRQILREEWRPDVILSCVFGQVIGPRIIAMPPYGIYNFHPSDLLHGHGAGPAPDEDLAARGQTETVWTIHQVSPEIDTGPVVAVSPPVTVADASGRLPDDRHVLYDKLIDPVGPLALEVVDALWKRFRAGEVGILDRLEVDAAFSEDKRARMKAPIRTLVPCSSLPVFDPSDLERYV